jgi:Zn-finger nucleic acid-binding protein
MIFRGARFCSHCGAQAGRKDHGAQASLWCPRCRAALQPFSLRSTPLRDCPKCGGVWSDALALERIRANQEEQAAVLGMAFTPATAGTVEEKVRYLPCPVCSGLMNRVNFARISGVVVDVCKEHGTWFDRDELRRTVEFIRSGGIDLARNKEIAELREQQRRLHAATVADNLSERLRGDPVDRVEREWGVSLLGSLVRALMD